MNNYLMSLCQTYCDILSGIFDQISTRVLDCKQEMNPTSLSERWPKPCFPHYTVFGMIDWSQIILWPSSNFIIIINFGFDPNSQKYQQIPTSHPFVLNRRKLQRSSTVPTGKNIFFLRSVFFVFLSNHKDRNHIQITTINTLLYKSSWKVSNMFAARTRTVFKAGATASRRFLNTEKPFSKENIPFFGAVVGITALIFQVAVLYPWHEELSYQFASIEVSLFVWKNE